MKYILLLATVFSFFQIGNAQTSLRDRTIHLSEVYGFCYGQKASLKWIKLNFPDLRNSVIAAESKWKVEFGKVEEEVERQLREILKNDYDSAMNLVEEKFKELNSFEGITEDDAINFIEVVNQRSKGNIEEAFKAKVLMYHPDFIQNPHEEFSRGYKNKYLSTGNEAKSKGVKIKFYFPASWLQEEGERPNVLFKATSQNGDGQTSMVIIIRDFKKEANGQLSPADLEQLTSIEGNRGLANTAFDEKSMKEMFLDSGIENPAFSSYKRVEVDGNPGAKINISGVKKRLEFEVPLEISSYCIICKNYLISVTFSSSGDSQEQAKSEFDKNQVLFNLIMNSVIIMNKYE